VSLCDWRFVIAQGSNVIMIISFLDQKIRSLLVNHESEMERIRNVRLAERSLVRIGVFSISKGAIENDQNNLSNIQEPNILTD
jgi:hypothetical protein